MRNNIKLSKRLQMVADMAGSPKGVIDVGTDHGYIPVYFALNGNAEMIAASDIRKGPLNSAENSAVEYGVHDKISFILANGLDGTDGTGIDTVIIAGMGGENIYDILNKAPWTKARRLILQPQSKYDEMLAWLDANGYNVVDSEITEDDKRLYIAFKVDPSGAECSLTDMQSVYEYLLRKHDKYVKCWITKEISKKEKALKEIQNSTNSEKLIDQYKVEIESLKELENQKW